MKVKYYNSGDEYLVEDGTRQGMVTITNLTSGARFENNCSRQRLDGEIKRGDVIVVKETDTILKVDSSELDKALAVAKELEATLLRIKALL